MKTAGCAHNGEMVDRPSVERFHTAGPGAAPALTARREQTEQTGTDGQTETVKGRGRP